jgi:hypothetical protein
MKKMLVLASVIALAACEPKAEEAPMADTTAAAVEAPAATDTAAMTTDTMMKADSAAMPADTMARDTAASH